MRTAGSRLQEWVAVLAAVALLEVLARAEILPSMFFPPPSRMAAALVTSIASGEILAHTAVTLGAYARGLLLAMAIAIPWGVVLGSVRPAYQACRVIIEFFRPIPSVATIPIAILVFGIGGTMRVAVIVYAAVWPLLFNTIYGVYNADPIAVDTARGFGFSRGEILARVLLPLALPYIATGVRVSSAIALILAVTAEMVAGTDGLGFYIKSMELGVRVAEMYGGILFVGALGYLLNSGMLAAERRALRWHRGAVGRTEGARA